MAAPIIALRDVAKRWSTPAAPGFVLAVPELEIGAGAHVALVGPSGSGKSTLLDMLALALPPDDCARFEVSPGDDKGEAAFDVGGAWRDRRHDDLAGLRRRALGYVLQTGGLLPFLSVRANIALPLSLNGRRDEGEVVALAERLGIAHRLDLKPAALSVGERQRAAIARALVHGPRIIIADEPTAAVDPVNAEAIFTLFAELVADTGVTAIVATHDHKLAEAHGLHVVQHELDRSGGDVFSSFSAVVA